MWRLSILGLMLVVALAALVLGLVARLGGEAVFYGLTPILGAIAAVRSGPGDRWAGVKGGLMGGFLQGVVGPLAFRRGYPFPDVAMITGGLFLQALAIHLGLGIILGLLVGAIAGSRPASELIGRAWRMWMPFRRELDDVFQGDRSIWLKMAGAGLAAAAVVVTATLRAINTGQIQAQATPGLIGTLAGGSAVAGAFLALLLSVKDMIERRTSQGRRVHPILRLYFGKGIWSLLLWFPTILFAAFGVLMVAAIIIAVVHK